MNRYIGYIKKATAAYRRQRLALSIKHLNMLYFKIKQQKVNILHDMWSASQQCLALSVPCIQINFSDAQRHIIVGPHDRIAGDMKQIIKQYMKKSLHDFYTIGIVEDIGNSQPLTSGDVKKLADDFIKNGTDVVMHYVIKNRVRTLSLLDSYRNNTPPSPYCSYMQAEQLNVNKLVNNHINCGVSYIKLLSYVEEVTQRISTMERARKSEEKQYNSFISQARKHKKYYQGQENNMVSACLKFRDV